MSDNPVRPDEGLPPEPSTASAAPPPALASDPDEAERFPWDADPAEPEAPADPDAPRVRHDAFTAERKRAFLRVLSKTGCIEDACRRTGVGRRTIYRHQEQDAAFRHHCALAVRMVATLVELTAWERAVDGVEQPFACGGEVHVRRRYDGGLLRLLLQASNPKKYGPRPGFRRKALLKFERRRMAREIRAEIAAEQKPWSFDEAMEDLERKLEIFGLSNDDQRRADGWTETPDGEWVPPGYAPIPGWQPPAGSGAGGGDDAGAADTPRDSL